MKNIGNFPLWIVAAVWLLQKGRLSVGLNPEQLSDLFYSLPVLPQRKRSRTWLLTRVIEWIFNAKGRLEGGETQGAGSIPVAAARR